MKPIPRFPHFRSSEQNVLLFMSLFETTFATVCYPIILILKFTNAVFTLRGKKHLMIHTFLSSEKTEDETIQIRLMEMQHFAVIAGGCLSLVLIHSSNSAITFCVIQGQM